MYEGLIFAIIAAVTFGVWTVFHKYASGSINNLFGAIVVSLTAVVVGLIFLLPKLKDTVLFTSSKGIIFAVLAGVCALAIDFFALKAYSTGMPIAVAGPIILGGSVAISAIIGFFVGDTITFLRVLGVLLITAGAAILGALG